MKISKWRQGEERSEYRKSGNEGDPIAKLRILRPQILVEETPESTPHHDNRHDRN